MSFWEYLPAYELSRKPRIIAAFDTDFLRNLEAFLEPLHNRRTFLNNNPDYVHYVLTEGNKKARVAANKTMSLVRRKMGL